MSDKPILFKRENEFDSLIDKWKKHYDKQFDMHSNSIQIHNVKGVISLESAFNPETHTWESNVSMYSTGLMQVLESTGKLLGWNPNLESMTNPDVSLKYGMLYLYQQYKKYKKWSDVYASYNAGSPKRKADGKYINQFYVDVVSAYSNFYYYRDVRKDNDMAVTMRARINELRVQEQSRRNEVQKEQDMQKQNYNIQTAIIVLIAVVAIYLIGRAKYK